MKVTNFLILLPLLFLGLCPSAKATTIVEKIFPCLTLVTDASTIDKSKTYVLVADDGENMYAVVDELGSNNKLLSLVLSANTDIKSQNIFFGLEYKSSKKGYEFKGKNTRLAYGYDNNKKVDILTNGKNYIGYLQICVASDYYNQALLLKGGVENRWLATNGNLYGNTCFGFYTGYIYKSDINESDYLPALIYEYDATKAATPIGSIVIKTDEGYGTFYLDQDYVMPEGVTGFTVTPTESEKLTLEKAYAAGETVPAKTALVVYGEQGTYSVFAPKTTSSESKRMARADENTKYLYGTTDSITTPKPDESKYYYFYKLCYLTDTENNKTLGFYWGEQDGAAFTNTPNRAYMAIEKAQASQAMGFAFPETEPTAIALPIRTTTPQPHGIYTLTGAKLNVTDPAQLPHGIFIVDGCKICK